MESKNTLEYVDALRYQHDGVWLRLPAWAKFFVTLGYSLARFDHTNKRFVVALAVPARAFAAAFISVGFVLGRAQIPFGESDQEHYEKLLELENGIPLIYIDKNRKKNARKVENKLYQGKLHIGIQIDEGLTNTVKYISPENARLISTSEKDQIKLPKQQTGRELLPPGPLVQKIMGNNNLHEFIHRTRLENILIGHRNKLNEELKTVLGVSEQGNVFQGVICDLLRVRELQQDNNAYRTSVVSSGSRNSIKFASTENTAYAVIFDHSLGFVKFNGFFKESNWIVVLDRTDPDFEYAVSQINQEYYVRSEKKIKFRFPPIPSNIEMMYFSVDL